MLYNIKMTEGNILLGSLTYAYKYKKGQFYINLTNSRLIKRVDYSFKNKGMRNLIHDLKLEMFICAIDKCYEINEKIADYYVLSDFDEQYTSEIKLLKNDMVIYRKVADWLRDNMKFWY